MFYKIADLIVEIPENGGVSSICREYEIEGNFEPEVVVNPEEYDRSRYPKRLSEESFCYMESGRQMYKKLLEFNGFYLHSSAVEFDGRAYLFSGPSGMGKSTHTRLWQKVFGEGAQVFNDDKPALRRIDGKWFAYGTPWCGKDGINQNKKVPLAGICFLKRGEENKIRRLEPKEAFPLLMSQTIFKIQDSGKLDLLLNSMNHLLNEIPIFELENKPVEEAAMLSHKTMLEASEEVFHEN